MRPQRPPPLRVTTTNAFAHRWLVPRLPLWRQVHPDIALDVNGTDALIDLQAGEADSRFAISAVRRLRSRPMS